jgi:dihydroxy-acid dehydratase
VAIGGCDKNMPGALIAIARMNRPAVFVYGGTILPGCITGDTRKLDVVSVFEAIGAHANKKISDANFSPSNNAPFPAPVPAAACTPPTPWPAPSKRSA